jgi:hypothetical protein
MFHRKRIIKIVCGSFLLLLGLAYQARAADGLELSIAQIGLVKPGVPNLRVTFRNLSDQEINLNLGTIGGHGQRPCKLDNREITCSFNFELNVTEAGGATRKFKFRGADYVAGRLDPYLVSVPAHSTQAIELGIDQFWAPDSENYQSLRLGPGKYDISLRFAGRAPRTINLDQPYIKQMSFWEGNLTSNTLPVAILP